MTPTEKTVIKICACGKPVSEEKKQEIKEHFEKGMLIEYLKESVSGWKFFFNNHKPNLSVQCRKDEKRKIKEIEAFISSL